MSVPRGQVIRGGPQRKASTRSAFEACAAELRRQGNVLLVLDQADGVLSQPAFQAAAGELERRRNAAANHPEHFR